MIPKIKVAETVDDRVFFTSLGESGKHYYYQNNHFKKIRFLNIPKNASTFIRDHLDLFINQTDYPLSFSIIRDPKERFISLYKYSVNVIELFDKFIEIIQQNKKISDYNILNIGIEHVFSQSFFIDNAPTEWKEGCQLISMTEFFAGKIEDSLHSLGIGATLDISNSKINPTDLEPPEYYDVIDDKINNQYKDFFDDYLGQDYEIFEKAIRRDIL